MTTIDSSAFVSQLQMLQSTMATLPSSLAQAAPSGAFADVLAQAQAAMEAVEQSATAPTVSTSGSGGVDASSLTGATATGGAVVADAEQYLGVPYQWGGTSATTGFDCSGLVQHVYGDLGVSLPRTSQEQATVGTAVPDLAAAQPGDLLFFEPGADGPGHVGIYMGGGMMIDAPHTGSSVQIEKVWGTPTAIRRILPTGAGSDVGAGTGAGAVSGPVWPFSGMASTGSFGAATAPAGIPASLGVPATLVPLFESAAQTYGVPASLLAAVAKQESGFDTGAVSPAGAEGLMQIMPGTAAGLGVNPYDPAQAIDGAAQILAGSLRQYGSVPLALAAYNAGGGAVHQYGGIPPYPETQNYVRNIMTMLSGAGS